MPLIGVDFTRHGCGPALYARHGFEEMGVIQAGGSPPMWPMLRNP